jgi:hypothetical protein
MAKTNKHYIAEIIKVGKSNNLHVPDEKYLRLLSRKDLIDTLFMYESKRYILERIEQINKKCKVISLDVNNLDSDIDQLNKLCDALDFVYHTVICSDLEMTGNFDVYSFSLS